MAGRYPRRIRIPLVAVLASFSLAATARAGVMMQAFYSDAPSPNFPSGDSHRSVTYWYDTLAAHAHEYAAAGITALWLPPPLKSAYGGTSLGYDPFDDYDIGSKVWNSPGNGSTRWGTRTQFERLAAMLHANGIGVYLDMVENHRNGDPGNEAFRYLDAYGVQGGGRFPKNPCDFHGTYPGNVPQDPNVPDENSSFGRDLAPINGCNRNVYNGLIDAGDWLTKAVDADGYRLDYVKGISTDWLLPFLNTKAMAGKFAVGEFWDGDVAKTRGWVNTMQGRASAFDFHTRFDLKDMCNGNGAWDMRNLWVYDSSFPNGGHTDGLAGVDPFHAVTFVENHDTDNDPNQRIVTNKALAYAYILTTEGYPCLFYRDYATDPGCYGLKPVIDNLIWIHEKLASGSTLQRWVDPDVFAYERLGGGHMLVGLNDNPNASHTITVATGFGANAPLHDYTGHGPDVTTDGSGSVTITVPKNAGGAGYVCYAPPGVSGGFAPARMDVTQEYAGAPDLDTRPAEAAVHNVASIYAMANAPIRLELWYHTDASWTPATRIDVALLDPNGAEVARSSFTSAGPQGGGFTYVPSTTGFHTFTIQAFNTSATDSKPIYWLKAHYSAPPLFQPEVASTVRAAGGLSTATPAQAQYAAGLVDITQATRLLRAYYGF